METRDIKSAKILYTLPHLDSYLAHLKNQKCFAENTLKAYRSDLLFWGRELVSRSPSAVLKFFDQKNWLEQLAGILDRTQQHEVKSSTRQRKLVSLKSYLEYLFSEMDVLGPLHQRIPLPKVKKTLPKIIDKNVLVKAFEAMAREQKNDKRNYALLVLMYGVGLRVSEVVNLTWDDILFDTQQILIKHGKGDKDRVVPLMDYVTDALNDLVENKYTNKSIFINYKGAKISVRGVQKIVKVFAKKNGLPEQFSPHWLRHAFASHVLTSGVSLEALRVALGHSSLATTEKYLHVSIQELSGIVDSAFSLE